MHFDDIPPVKQVPTPEHWRRVAWFFGQTSFVEQLLPLKPGRHEQARE
jgi:hypothetical protein